MAKLTRDICKQEDMIRMQPTEYDVVSADMSSHITNGDVITRVIPVHEELQVEVVEEVVEEVVSRVDDVHVRSSNNTAVLLPMSVSNKFPATEIDRMKEVCSATNQIVLNFPSQSGRVNNINKVDQVLPEIQDVSGNNTTVKRTMISEAGNNKAVNQPGQPQELYTCAKCNYCSHNKHYLKQHVQLVHLADRPFKCPFCNYAGKRSHSLKEHLIVHSKCRPYQCSHCNATFRKKGHLTNHTRMHNNTQITEKCELCQRSFTTKDGYYEHLRNKHDDTEAYLCGSCNFATFDSNAMIGHIQDHDETVVPLGNFVCETCEESFSTTSLLSQHISEKHGDQAVHSMVQKQQPPAANVLMKCSECGFETSDTEILRKHMLDVHIESTGCASNTSLKSNEKAGTYKCSKCCYKTSSSIDYFKHMTNHMDLSANSVSSKTEREVDGATSKQENILRPVQPFTHDKSVGTYRCTICSYTCEHQRTIKSHIWKHSGHSAIDYPMFQNGPISVYDDTPIGVPMLIGNKSVVDVKNKSHAQSVSVKVEEDSVDRAANTVAVPASSTMCKPTILIHRKRPKTVNQLLAEARHDTPETDETKSSLVKLYSCAKQNNVPIIKSVVATSLPEKSVVFKAHPSGLSECPATEVDGKMLIAFCKSNTGETVMTSATLDNSCKTTSSRSVPNILRVNKVSTSVPAEIKQESPSTDVKISEETASKQLGNHEIFIETGDSNETQFEVNEENVNAEVIWEAVSMPVSEAGEKIVKKEISTVDVLSHTTTKRKISETESTNDKKVCAEKIHAEKESANVVVQQLPHLYEIPKVHVVPNNPSSAIQTDVHEDTNEQVPIEDCEKTAQDDAVIYEDNRQPSQEIICTSDDSHTLEFIHGDIKTGAEVFLGAETEISADPYESDMSTSEEQVMTSLSLLQREPNHNSSMETGTSTDESDDDGQQSGDNKPKQGICSSLLAVIEQLRERSKSESDNTGDKYSSSAAYGKRKRDLSEEKPREGSIACHKNIEVFSDNPVQFRCKLCHYSNNNSTTMKAHLKLHKDKKPTECSLCEFEANSNETLQDHMLQHCKVRFYQCKQCASVFCYKSNLRIHMRACHQQADQSQLNSTSEMGTEDQDDEDKQMASTDQVAADVVDKRCMEDYSCKKCEFQTSDLYSYDKHMLWHAGSKPYKCENCDFSTGRLALFTSHMSNHLESKDLKCQFCDFVAISTRSLKSHMKRHVNDQKFVQQPLEQYKCNLCGYVCHHLPSLKSHMWRHASDKNYSYQDTNDIINAAIDGNDQDEEAVDPSATENAALLNRKNNWQVRFRCCQCGFESVDRAELATHMKTHMDVVWRSLDMNRSKLVSRAMREKQQNTGEPETLDSPLVIEVVKPENDKFKEP